MRLPGPPASSASSRFAANVWLALAILLQGWLMGYQATAMATGIEVCSAAGSKRVDADGNPLPSSHGGHDCCGTAASLPPPSHADAAVLLLQHDAPTEPLSAGRRSAQWMAPLSRGPPSPSQAPTLTA